MEALVSYPFRPSLKRKGKEDHSSTPGNSKSQGPEKKKPKKGGKISPSDDILLRKYSELNMPENVRTLFRKHVQKSHIFSDNLDLQEECLRLVSNSLAKRTWNKYSSALHLWEKFEKCKDIKKFSAIVFTCWCSKNTKIRASTIKQYTSALRKLKFLLGFKARKDSGLEKILVRGIQNIENKVRLPDPIVTPISLQILANIRKGLDNSNCSACSKISIWTLSLTAFWGLIRLGEMLPALKDKFDETSTLLWKDVELFSDRVILHLKNPKTRAFQSKKVTLFKVKTNTFCPVFYFHKMEKIQKIQKVWNLDSPVFSRTSGKALTKISFVKGINVAVNLVSITNIKLQGKSFRSGIPSLLNDLSDNVWEHELKILGRWKGDSYRCYVRDPALENRSVFHSVANLLIEKFLHRQEALPEPDPGQQQ